MANERLRTRDKVFSTFLLIVGFVLLALAPAANAAKVELMIIGGGVALTGLLTMTRPRKG